MLTCNCRSRWFLFKCHKQLPFYNFTIQNYLKAHLCMLVNHFRLKIEKETYNSMSTHANTWTSKRFCRDFRFCNFFLFRKFCNLFIWMLMRFSIKPDKRIWWHNIVGVYVVNGIVSVLFFICRKYWHMWDEMVKENPHFWRI